MTTMTQQTPDLINVICETSMRSLAAIVRRSPNLRYDKLTALLREEIKNGYSGLLADGNETGRSRKRAV